MSSLFGSFRSQGAGEKAPSASPSPSLSQRQRQVTPPTQSAPVATIVTSAARKLFGGGEANPLRGSMSPTKSLANGSPNKSSSRPTSAAMMDIDESSEPSPAAFRRPKGTPKSTPKETPKSAPEATPKATPERPSATPAVKPGSSRSATRRNQTPLPTGDDTEDEEHEIDGVINHRWKGDFVELQVKWSNSPPSWEPETGLQLEAPLVVEEYWEAKGGREENPKKPGQYVPLAILGHKDGKKKFTVQWAGYGTKDATEEPRKTLEDIAPELLREYLKTVARPPGRKPGKAKRRGGAGAAKKGTAKPTGRGGRK